MLKNNTYFAHSKNVAMAMLCDLDQSVQNLALNNIFAIRETRKLQNVMIGSELVQGATMEQIKESLSRSCFKW